MSNAMNFKGYDAKIDYSNEDEIFFGTILGINDLITFEGECINDLKNAFHDAVDDYLEMCERLGKEPQKAFKGSFNVRIEPNLHKKSAIMASTNGISLNQFVEDAINHYVNDKSDVLQSLKKSYDKIEKSINGLYSQDWNYNNDSYDYNYSNIVNPRITQIGISRRAQ